jgi:hypothetical protein
MTNVNHTRGHTPRRPSEQLLAEAVVASYIHDISARRHRSETANDRALLELRRPAHRRQDEWESRHLAAA